MDDLTAQTATAFQHALVMAALADGRSRFTDVQPDAQTQWLIDGLLGLGVSIITDEETERIDVAGTRGYWPNSDAELHAADSFPLACMLISACAVGRGQYTVICELPPELERSLIPLLSALIDLRASLYHESQEGRMVVNVGPESIRGGTIRLPMGCPPAVLDSLLLVAPYALTDVMIEAGAASAHATEQVIPIMDTFGVSVLEDGGRLIVAASQRYQGREMSGCF